MRKVKDFISKNYTTFCLLFITFSFILISYNNKFIFGQDSLTYHLPVARYLAEHNTLPKYVPYDLYHEEMKKPPLLYLLTYPFFKIFGANEVVAEIVPLTLQFIFLSFMWWWLEKEGAKFPIYLITLLISFYVIDLLVWYYQACVVVLFSAISFYFFIKFFDEWKERDLLLLALFSSLSALSKTTGFAILILFAVAYTFYIHKKGRDLKKVTIITLTSLLLISPAIWWYVTHNTLSQVEGYVLSSSYIFRERLGIWIFHPEFVVMLGIVLGFYDKLKPSERVLLFTSLPIILLAIYKGAEPRYISLFSPLTIFLIAKYLSRLPFNRTFLKAVLVLVMTIFILNPLFNFFNPQYGKEVQLHHLRDACSYLTSTYGEDKFVVGDADFGIGWWCRYNFTTLKKYLANTSKYPKPDFVLDCWWDFCSHPLQNYCEKEDLKKMEKVCQNLTLIWSDRANYIYKCG